MSRNRISIPMCGKTKCKLLPIISEQYDMKDIIERNGKLELYIKNIDMIDDIYLCIHTEKSIKRYVQCSTKRHCEHCDYYNISTGYCLGNNTRHITNVILHVDIILSKRKKDESYYILCNIGNMFDLDKCRYFMLSIPEQNDISDIALTISSGNINKT